jgi:hypothetical protein
MTVLENEEAFVPKLLIWQTTKAAYRDTFGNFDAVAIAATVPFGLSVLLDLVLPDESVDGGLNLIRLFLTSIIFAVFEISWFRHLLLQSTAARPSPLPPVGRRLSRYIAYSVLLTLLFVPAWFFEAALVETAEASPVNFGIFLFILYAAASYLAIRFSFVYLWVALDEPQRLGESWRRTRKNALRILIATCLTVLPLVLFLAVFVIVIATTSPELAAQFENGAFEGGAFWVVVIGGNALLYLVYALSCAVLAHAFCALTGWQRGRRELLERFE